MREEVVREFVEPTMKKMESDFYRGSPREFFEGFRAALMFGACDVPFRCKYRKTSFAWRLWDGGFKKGAALFQRVVDAEGFAVLRESERGVVGQDFGNA